MIVASTQPNRENVKLVPIDEGNYDVVVQLSLPDSQKEFIPDVASSIELAAKYEYAQAFGITFGEKVVGFGLYGVDESTGKWKIFRLLVDENYQGHGIGRFALERIIAELRTEKDAQEILITYHHENHGAARLYNRFGFVEYDRDDEKVLAKLLNDKAM